MSVETSRAAGKKSARGWFQEILTYTKWPQMPNAHGPFGKDKLTPRERKALQGVPLFINVQTPAAIREAHRMGGRALSYLSFMDTYVHTAGFENGTARVPWDPGKPQILLLNKDGCFVNTRMDGTRRMWRYTACNNTREYVELALKMVHEQMRNGADGIFVDNSGPRIPCYGHGIPVGYSTRYRSVVTAIPEWKHRHMVENKLPEELFRLGERPGFQMGPALHIPRHRHIYPGKSHDYAYARLLEKVRHVVRSYGPDKVVVVNAGIGGDPRADGIMLESFMYSWICKGRLKDWNQAKAEARKGRSYLKRGGRFAALCYFGNTDRSIAEDAFYSFSAAVLLGFLWSDYGTVTGPLGKKLRTLRLGQRLTRLLADASIGYAFFENGLVAINGGSRTRAATVSARSEFRPARLKSLIDNKVIALGKGAYRLSLPAHTGRVYLAA